MLRPRKRWSTYAVLFIIAFVLPSLAIALAHDIAPKRRVPSLPSRLLFKYVNPLVLKSKETALSFRDALPSTTNTRNDGGPLWERFKRSRAQHPDGNKTWQLASAMLSHQKSQIITSGVLRLANTAVQAFPALLISRVLKLLESGASRQLAIRATLQLIAVLTVKMMLENQYFDKAIQTSIAARSSLTELIFHQGLVVAANNNTGDAGSILNLMQSDVGFVESAALQLHTAWDAVLQIAMYTALLYKFLGKAVFYGVSVLLITIPLNAALLSHLTSLSLKETTARQARTQRTTESLRSIQLLKLLSWDAAPEIKAERDRELSLHERRGVVRATSTAIFNTVPALVLVVTMAAYARTKQPITASIVFTAISLFNQLRFPLFFLPMWMDSYSNAKAATSRMAEFLSQPKLETYREQNSSGGQYLEMRNGNFVWPSTQAPALENVNIRFAPGTVTAVVGSVGSGKSALLQALLGELQPDSTAAEKAAVVMGTGTNGEIAYCSQQAWLPKGSVRDAIVFGRPFDAQLYARVKYCAGLDDEAALTDGTSVGEGGSSLSGGQRARVALARALYSKDASVILLDDSLAALDAKVKSTVLERTIAYVRERGAVTILVTNDAYVPQRCDQVVVMGKSPTSRTASIVKDVGGYGELKSRGCKLPENASTNTHHQTTKVPTMDSDSSHKSLSSREIRVEAESHIHVVGSGLNNTEALHNVDLVEKSARGQKLHHKHSDVEGSTTSDSGQVPIESETATASTDDKIAGGAVPIKIYKAYLKSVRSPLLVLSVVASFMLSNGAQFFQQYTVAKWTEAGVDAVSRTYLQTLLRAAGVVSVTLWIRSFLTMKLGIRASRFWHNSMLKSVFAAPMSFFDSTPSGQLLSRFGKEIEVVDRGVPDSIGNVLYCFLQIFFSAGALIGVVTPGMLLPLSLVGIMYTKTMSRFRPAARDMKRSETKTRSPIYTHFGETIRGAATIRSVPGARKAWATTHKNLTDTNLRVYRTGKALDRWLSIRLEALGNIVVFATAVSSVFLSKAGRLSSGSAGWGLTQSLAITGLMAWAVRTLTELESNVMSVMRVQELTDVGASETAEKRIPRELSKPGEALPSAMGGTKTMALSTQTSDALRSSGWPWKGHVQFSNVSMRYNEGSPLVLNGVSIDIPAGSTLGVVGRTGSGKSSLLLTLFRLVEIESEGTIFVDGVDIRSVGMQTLRKSLSIIPQDPTLFTGTLATNLDRTGEASEEDMMTALEAASPALAEFFRSRDGLATQISAGGQNLSVGQRQLLCLARALVRKSKVLVLE